MLWGAGQAERSLCVGVCVCVCRGSSQRGLGKMGGGSRGREQGSVWVREGRGGGTIETSQNKTQKQEAGGEGPGRSP